MCYCPQCEEEVPQDSNFCHMCGEELEQSTKREAQHDSASLFNAIDKCKTGTQKLIHATSGVTNNVVQIQRTKVVDGPLMTEAVGNISIFLTGVEELKNGVANIEAIQQNDTAITDHKFSSEYIKHAQSVIISSGKFFDSVNFKVEYKDGDEDKSVKLNQLSTKDDLGETIETMYNISLHGEEITHSAEKLVNDCESFIETHNRLFGESEYRI